MSEDKRKIVEINKVYTRGGDKGETSLSRGERVPKNHPRVAAFGTIDELNSLMGHIRYSNLKKNISERRDKFDLILKTIQQRLFDLGSELATRPENDKQHKLTLTNANVTWLENIIDEMNKELKPLDSFVLPGGGELNSYLHQARTICRRAERQVVTLSCQEEIGPWVLPYINRLSDALFVFSRWVSSKMEEMEFLWEPGKKDPDNWKWKKSN